MGRGAYVVKRLAFAAVTILVAVTVNFVLFRALPGGAVSDLSRVPRATPALQHALARDFGLDKPIGQQYLIYLDRLAHGDLGVSFDDRQPVSHKLWAALVKSLPMVTIGTVLAIGFGVVAGVISAWRRGTLTDHLSTNLAISLFALPAQWLALMLLILFAGKLPTGGMSDEFLIHPSLWQHNYDLARHMVLPALTLALGLYGGYTLIVRSTMIDTLGEDFILTARAKGLSSGAILRRHALRNALLPTTTLIALSLGHLVAGAILVETVFSWPGIGRAVYQAVLDRDYPVLQGAFLLLTVSVVACNLIADLILFRLDPRVTA
jgi:ABC-type dipeptide/oligopeptide/nickel transport system permease component